MFGNCVTLVDFATSTTVLTFDTSIRLEHTPERSPDFRIEDYARSHPFSYDSEELADQERSVARSRRLGPPNDAHAEGHLDIIRRFGRFPHRNPILGRAMRPEEQRFLDDGGYAG